MIRSLAVVLFFAVAAWSQTTGTANIIGNVTDSSGAAVPRAKITVQNQDTAFRYEGASGDTGEYYIPNLSSGTYQLTVEAAGFKTTVQRDIILRINETPRINVRLDVGSITESVNITSKTPLLETENAGVGQVMESSVVRRLPMCKSSCTGCSFTCPT